MSEITGGEVYHSDKLAELVSRVSEHTVSESTGIEIIRFNMQLWFALAALGLFFTDIVIRRVREIRRGRG
jgi:hypothetical protein